MCIELIHIASISTYVILSQVYCSYIMPFLCSNQHDGEHLPDIIWCRDPFTEALNEIEDINYVDYESVNQQT